MLIAGHTFQPGPDARCTCGRAWAEIAHVTDAHVGLPDLAHVGTLNAREADEIAAERARRADREAAIWAAVEGVAAG